MREILFRGKIAKCDWEASIGKWMYGELSTDYGGNYWVGNAYNGYMIDPETLGQYTGVEDMTGVKIFEGDIIRFYHDTGDYEDGTVFWKASHSGFSVSWRAGDIKPLDFLDNKNYEVVGNKWDGVSGE